MKDIVIKGSWIKRELLYLLGSFVAAELVNLGAILAYDRPFSELYVMIGYVLLFTLLIYLVAVLVRLLVYIICKTLKLR